MLVTSVTEGEDKPLKSPTLINSCDAVVIGKIDLAAALDFDLSRLRENIDRVRPGVSVFELSARTGAGIDGWLDFLRRSVEEKRARHAGGR